MIYQNITLSVEPVLEDVFIDYLKTTVHPFIKSKFESSSIVQFKLITDVENGFSNLPLQIEFKNEEDYNAFNDLVINEVYELLNAKFANQYYFFSTLLVKI